MQSTVRRLIGAKKKIFPAAHKLARDVFCLLNVLSKEKGLHRSDFTSHRYLQVVERNLAILIKI